MSPFWKALLLPLLKDVVVCVAEAVGLKKKEPKAKKKG